MQKKMIIIFSLFLCTAHQQFAALHQAVRLLQRCSGLGKNSLFTHQFLTLRRQYKQDPVEKIRLFSQIPLDEKLENELFKLAVEDGVDIQILVRERATQVEWDILTDMQKEGIDIREFPDEYRSIDWQEEYEEDGFLSDVKITNNENIIPSMAGALIAYRSGMNIIVFSKDRETLCIQNGQSFDDLQEKFDCVFAKSKE